MANNLTVLELCMLIIQPVQEQRETMEIPLSLVRRDDLVLCSESEELKVMVGCFVQICRRKSLEVNADKR